MIWWGKEQDKKKNRGDKLEKTGEKEMRKKSMNEGGKGERKGKKDKTENALLIIPEL